MDRSASVYMDIAIQRNEADERGKKTGIRTKLSTLDLYGCVTDRNNEIETKEFKYEKAPIP